MTIMEPKEALIILINTSPLSEKDKQTLLDIVPTLSPQDVTLLGKAFAKEVREENMLLERIFTHITSTHDALTAQKPHASEE